MQLTRWSFDNLSMPMLEDEHGNFFCTAKALCEALQINPNTLRSVCMEHADELTGLSVGNSNAKEAVAEHRVELGVQRIRDDMRLFSEDDMIMIALLSKSSVSVEFRRSVKDMIKNNARRGYVRQEEFDTMATRLDQVEAILKRYGPALETMTSAAGTSLRAARDLKRDPN